jgi:basic membrane protein A
MAINVDRQLENIVAGTFKGQNIVLKADTDSTGFVKTEGHQQLSADTIAKLDAAYTAVKAGKIVPAANFNGITPETFTVSK